MPDFSLVPSTAAASGVFVEEQAVTRSLAGFVIPQKIAVLGQYNAGKTPTANVAVQITSLADAWNRYGRGSLLSIMIEAALRVSGSVPIYAIPLADDGSGVAATGSIAVGVTTVGAGTLSLYIAGKKVTVAVAAGATADAIGELIEAAINANLDLPVTASNTSGTVTLTARHKGAFGNGINIAENLDAIDAPLVPSGVTLTITAMASGATNPVLTTALANLGDTFYTFIANPYSLDLALDAIEAAWVARLDPGVKRPFAAISAYTDTLANYTTFLADRNSPATTIIPVEGSPNMVAEIAAVACARMARSAESDVARPFKNQTLPGIRGGAAANWTYAQRDAIVKLGGSTSYKDSTGVVWLGDCVTTYTTSALGAEDAATSWRFTTSVTKLQAKIYSLDQLFLASPFDRAIVVDDEAVTSKSYAISPRKTKAFVIKLVDDLWIAQGWSTNRAAIVAGIVASINGTNPARIDVLVPDVMSAELSIVAVKLEWGFTAAA